MRVWEGGVKFFFSSFFFPPPLLYPRCLPGGARGVSGLGAGGSVRMAGWGWGWGRLHFISFRYFSKLRVPRGLKIAAARRAPRGWGGGGLGMPSSGNKWPREGPRCSGSSSVRRPSPGSPPPPLRLPPRLPPQPARPGREGAADARPLLGEPTAGSPRPAAAAVRVGRKMRAARWPRRGGACGAGSAGGAEPLMGSAGPFGRAGGGGGRGGRGGPGGAKGGLSEGCTDHRSDRAFRSASPQRAVGSSALRGHILFCI